MSTMSNVKEHSPQQSHHELTEQEIAQYQDAFALFDTDQDGKIWARDLGTVMRSLGLSPSEAHLSSLLSKCPVDPIDFPQFLTLMARQMKYEQANEISVREAFSIFDRDNTGHIQVSELKRILSNLGEPLSDADLDALFANCANTVDTIDNKEMLDYNKLVDIILDINHQQFSCGD